MSVGNLIPDMQSQVARFFVTTTIQIVRPGISTLGADLGVTIGTNLNQTVPCSAPRDYQGGDNDPDKILTGSTYVLVDRTDSALTFEPQEGDIANLSGEQYRVRKVVYLPGSVRIFLKGGAAEGTAGS